MIIQGHELEVLFMKMIARKIMKENEAKKECSDICQFIKEIL